MNPHEPSEAPPGTSQKLDLLARRAELGLELFHPEDAAETGDLNKWDHLGRGGAGRYEDREYREVHLVEDDDD